MLNENKTCSMKFKTFMSSLIQSKGKGTKALQKYIKFGYWYT